jgi:hypothetical protein
MCIVHLGPNLARPKSKIGEPCLWWLGSRPKERNSRSWWWGRMGTRGGLSMVRLAEVDEVDDVDARGRQLGSEMGTA